jgi:uncharacterized membrane protein YfcA
MLLFYSEIALAALIAGTLDTVVGFGGGLLLLPILIIAAGSKDGVVLGALIPLGWNIPRIVLLRQKINWRITALVGAGILPGSILGARYLDLVDARLLQTIVGITLIVLGVYYVIRLYLDLPGPRSVKAWVYPVIGLISGGLAGLLGAGNGPFQSGVLAASALSVREVAATNGALGGLTAITRLAAYGAQGMLHEELWLAGTVGFVFAFAGAYLGIQLSSRAKNSTLELVLGVAIVLAGIKMVM